MIEDWMFVVGFLELSAVIVILALTVEKRLERLEEELRKLKESRV